MLVFSSVVEGVYMRVSRHWMSALVIGLAFSACGGSDVPDVANTESRFYRVESFTLVRKLEGIHSGTVTEHVRNYGNERAEIRDVETRIAGFTQKDHTKTITRGAEITTVDLSAGTASRMDNPFYAAMVQNMKGDGLEFGARMMRQMGGKPTGKTREIAGHECDVWEGAQMNQTMCVTEGGITLQVSSEQVNVSDTAIEVRMGDPGPDDAYEVPEGMVVTAGPSLTDLFNKASDGSKDGAPQLNVEEMMKRFKQEQQPQ